MIFNINSILDALNCFQLRYDRFSLIICTHNLIYTHFDYEIQFIRY